MIFAPLEGWRHVEVTDRHTAVDYAHILKELSDTRWDCPDFGGIGRDRSLEDPRQPGISSSDEVAGGFRKRFDPQCLDTPSSYPNSLDTPDEMG
jgi:hypothetical protein